MKKGRIVKESVFEDCSYQIISAFYEVHKKCGPGFPEKGYQNALYFALKKRGLLVECEKKYEMRFDGHLCCEFRADLVVNNQIIIEVKAVNKLLSLFKSQLISYLKASGIPVGLLVNFAGESVEFKRVIDFGDHSREL